MIARLQHILNPLVVLQIVFGLLVLTGGLRLVFQPDPHDDLRRADGLFMAGRYYEALGLYGRVETQAPQQPRPLVRRGMVETLRGEAIKAGRTFAQAINLGASGQDYELARLYQGRALALNDQDDEAFDVWRLIDDRSQFRPFRHVLEAETLLGNGRYAEAESSYRAALDTGLPKHWKRVAHSRIAALRASSDPAGAQAELTALNIGSEAGVPEDPLVAPLLPTPAPAPEQLVAVLSAVPEQRAQLLGQLYLDAGLYGLAEAQFAVVPAESAQSVGAKAYAAYARLLAGDRAGGQEQLETLVAERPDDSGARALLALAYLARTEPMRARAQLEIIRTLAPRSPDTHLAWGQWYAAQHDYLAAADQYRRALEAAPIDQRGTYLLALARFHLDTTVRACEGGRPAAEEAARLLNDSAGWIALAEAQLACGDAAHARDAAATALQRAPNSAEAQFYLGRALVLLDKRIEARQAFIAAADLAPASDWRAKAERQL